MKNSFRTNYWKLLITKKINQILILSFEKQATESTKKEKIERLHLKNTPQKNKKKRAQEKAIENE